MTHVDMRKLAPAQGVRADPELSGVPQVRPRRSAAAAARPRGVGGRARRMRRLSTQSQRRQSRSLDGCREEAISDQPNTEVGHIFQSECKANRGKPRHYRTKQLLCRCFRPTNSRTKWLSAWTYIGMSCHMVWPNEPCCTDLAVAFGIAFPENGCCGGAATGGRRRLDWPSATCRRAAAAPPPPRPAPLPPRLRPRCRAPARA